VSDRLCILCDTRETVPFVANKNHEPETVEGLVIARSLARAQVIKEAAARQWEGKERQGLTRSCMRAACLQTSQHTEIE